MAVKITDAHTHVQMSPKAALVWIEDLNRDTTPELTFTIVDDGTIPCARASMERVGIDRTLLVPWIAARQIYTRRREADPSSDPEVTLSTLRAEWEAYNSWGLETASRFPGQFYTVTAVDPVLFGADWTRSVFKQSREQGSLALKITPMFIGRQASDPDLEVLWQLADEYSVPILSMSTAALDPGSLAAIGLNESDANVNHPDSFEDGLRSYPNARAVLAHMGYFGAEDRVARLTSLYPNVYADTTEWIGLVGAPGGITPLEAANQIRAIGTDRVLFGSNYPLFEQTEILEKFLSIPLTNDEQEQVLHLNFDAAYRPVGV
jgi:predicted TIM-barrel fold metal-dependent hydrolase